MIKGESERKGFQYAHTYNVQSQCHRSVTTQRVVRIMSRDRYEMVADASRGVKLAIFRTREDHLWTWRRSSR